MKNQQDPPAMKAQPPWMTTATLHLGRCVGLNAARCVVFANDFVPLACFIYSGLLLLEGMHISHQSIYFSLR
jgi:hypothetical protein